MSCFKCCAVYAMIKNYKFLLIHKHELLICDSTHFRAYILLLSVPYSYYIHLYDLWHICNIFNGDVYVMLHQVLLSNQKKCNCWFQLLLLLIMLHLEFFWRCIWLAGISTPCFSSHNISSTSHAFPPAKWLLAPSTSIIQRNTLPLPSLDCPCEKRAESQSDQKIC